MAVVNSTWLKKQLDNPNHKLVILDVTWFSDKDAKQDYTKKHIQGSQWFNIMADVEFTDAFPRNLPTPEAFQKQARSMGVNSDSHVIVYDNTPHCGYFVGGRVWWMFKLHGHQTISILDGGLTNWDASGYSVTDQLTKAKEGNFTNRLNPRLKRTYEDMDGNLATKRYQVFDTRPEAAYKGNPDDSRTGHYPGALSMALGSVLLDKEKNALQPLDKLQQIFRERGVDFSRPVVCMCRSGMSSSTAALVATMCGAKDVSVYLGGFTEWSIKADGGNIEQSL